MKNRTLNIALLSLIIACSSCNKITESIQQDIIVNDTVEFNIPTLNSITNLTTISGIPSKLNLEEQIKNNMNNFTVDNVKSVKLTTLNMALGLIAKDSIDINNNFGNLETIRFRISNNSKTNNIANTSIASGSKNGFISLTPTVIPDTLKSFLVNPVKTYEVIVKAKTVTSNAMRVRAAASYTVTLSR